jgi:hypothetical protein
MSHQQERGSSIKPCRQGRQGLRWRKGGRMSSMNSGGQLRGISRL